MMRDFKGHHFVEDSKHGEPPSTHHCDRCGLKAALRPDGSVFFDIERNGVFLRTDNDSPFKSSRVPPCKGWSVVRPRPAWSAIPVHPELIPLHPGKLRHKWSSTRPRQVEIAPDEPLRQHRCSRCGRDFVESLSGERWAVSVSVFSEGSPIKSVRNG